jgi:hypothetical protein
MKSKEIPPHLVRGVGVDGILLHLEVNNEREGSSTQYKGNIKIDPDKMSKTNLPGDC